MAYRSRGRRRGATGRKSFKSRGSRSRGRRRSSRGTYSIPRGGIRM